MRIFSVIILVFLTSCSCSRECETDFFNLKITDPQLLMQLFPSNTREINYRAELLKCTILNDIAHIIAVDGAVRTFENTAQAFDELGRKAHMVIIPLSTLFMVSPDKAIRECAYQQQIMLNQFMIEHVGRNVQLFKAFRSYVEQQSAHEVLDDEQRYYLQETMKSFIREGLALPAAQQERVQMLQKQLSELTAAFSKNIYNAVHYLPFTQQELVGVSGAALAVLKQDEQGHYLVGLDYPTVHAVLEHAHVEQTRKQVLMAFENRAYPENYKLLKDIITLRNELAHLLGFANYAAYNLADEMAKNPQTVLQFERDIEHKTVKKSRKEAQELTKWLPAQVQLTANGKIKPWDFAYLKEEYKQRMFNLDMTELSEYFPADYVVEQIGKVYARFLGIQLVEQPCQSLWFNTVRCLAVYDAQNQLRGYLLLDLYPRSNKYTHAALIDVINGQKTATGFRPTVAIIVANLPQGVNGKPGLFTFEDVKTFFHEFGHAMHAMLGSTRMHAFTGINTKIDFVELPSQMFEEWLYDKEILQLMSKHYKTGKPLPEAMIVQLGRLMRFDGGDFIMRQCVLGRFALEVFMGTDQDIQQLYMHVMSTLRPYLYIDNAMHWPASFDHLMGYGARYYSYLWSRVFAIDILMVLKKQGLQNPVAGRKFVDKILSKGGSVEPEQLLYDFLGRAPSTKALVKYYDLN